MYYKKYILTTAYMQFTAIKPRTNKKLKLTYRGRPCAVRLNSKTKHTTFF